MTPQIYFIIPKLYFEDKSILCGQTRPLLHRLVMYFRYRRGQTYHPSICNYTTAANSSPIRFIISPLYCIRWSRWIHSNLYTYQHTPITTYVYDSRHHLYLHHRLTMSVIGNLPTATTMAKIREDILPHMFVSLVRVFMFMTKNHQICLAISGIIAIIITIFQCLLSYLVYARFYSHLGTLGIKRTHAISIIIFSCGLFCP